MDLWIDDRDGAGLPVLLLHGGWTDSRVWDQVISLLPGRRVIRYDARGYGRSAAPSGPFTQYGDALAVLDHAGVDRAVLVGHSGGGATALSIAVEQPYRVAGLVLLAPGVADYPWPLTDPYFAEVGAAFAAGDREKITEIGLRAWAPGDDSPTTRALLRDAVDAMSTYGENCEPDPPAFDRLAGVAAPATLLLGGRDHHTVRECAEAVAARLPACRTLRVPDADHLLPLRVPALIAASVRP